MYRICYRSPVPFGKTPRVGEGSNTWNWRPRVASLTGTSQSRPANVSSADGQHKCSNTCKRVETETPGDDLIM